MVLRKAMVSDSDNIEDIKRAEFMHNIVYYFRSGSGYQDMVW